LAKGDEDGALKWFGHAADADVEGETDAGERLSELDGLELVDLLRDDEDQDGDQDEDHHEGRGEHAGGPDQRPR
jgi:hypothetical protein